MIHKKVRNFPYLFCVAEKIGLWGKVIGLHTASRQLLSCGKGRDSSHTLRMTYYAVLLSP